MHPDSLEVTQRFHQSFHSRNHNSCKQTLSNPYEFSWLGKPLSRDHRPHGHQPQGSSMDTWRHAVSPRAHCIKSEHSSELGSQMKSTMIRLQQNHSDVHGPRSHADSAERNKELLSPERLELSHTTELQPGGHAWECREQIRKRNPEG